MFQVAKVLGTYLLAVVILGVLLMPAGLYGEPPGSAFVGACLSSPLAFALATWVALRSLHRSIGRHLLIAAIAAMTLMLFGFGSAPPEGVYLWNPMIDTRIAPGFTVNGFEQIRDGMTPGEVTAILGEPFLKRVLPLRKPGYEEEWEYSTDGACTWGDFAWKGFVVIFGEGRVVKKSSAWRFD